MDREQLEQIAAIDEAVKGMAKELERIREQRSLLKAVGYNLPVADIEGQLMERIGELAAERRQITARIYALPDEKQVEALALRFIDGLRIDEVADRMDLSYRSILRIIRDGIKNLG